MVFSTEKRRYSSTAVGFPIRYDLRAYSQGISKAFPSRVCAHRARLYVRVRPITKAQSTDALPKCWPTPVHLLSFSSPAHSQRIVNNHAAAEEHDANTYIARINIASDGLKLCCGSLGSHLQSHDAIDNFILCSFMTSLRTVNSQ